jgi:hypothetical protein
MKRIFEWMFIAGLLLIAPFAASGAPSTNLQVVEALEGPRAESTLSANSSLESLHFKNFNFTVPSGATKITVSIINGSGNLDLYVKKGTKVSGSTVSELEADADFVSNGSGANEQVVVTTASSPALAAGTWYAAVINRGTSTTSFTVQVVITTPDGGSTTSSSFTPQVGLWYNAEQSGHGVDIELTQPNAQGVVTMSAVLYTYKTDRSPTWYQALGPLTGPTWTADVLAWSWDGSKATSSKVGTVTIQFSDRTHAKFSWTIDGHSFSEDMERFLVAEGVPPTVYTGLWYQLSKPGFGYSVDTQGSGNGRTEAIVGYIYGCAGEPRWVMTIISGNVNPASAATSYPSIMFSGSCPWCTFSPSTPKQVGSLKRSYSSASAGTMVNQFTMPAPVSCSWNVNISDLRLLSAPVDRDLLEVELVLDEVLGLTNVGGSAVEDWVNVLSTVLGGGSSTCPTTSTTGPTGAGTSASPYVIGLSASFGSGCTGADGATWSGSASGQVELVAGATAISADIDVTLNSLKRDGVLIGNGSASGVLDVVVSGGGTLASGSASLTANATSANGPVSGTIDITLDSIDLSILASSGSSTPGPDAILDILGTSGEIMVDFKNVKSGTDTVDGEILFSAVSATQQSLDINLTTNAGPVDILMMITNTSGSEYSVNTPSAGNVQGYTVRMNNLKFDVTQCETAPTGGSVDIDDYRFLFDGTCVGYETTKL